MRSKALLKTAPPAPGKHYYGAAADIYSFSILVRAVVTGEPNDPPVIPEFCEEWLQELARMSGCHDQENRSTAGVLHAFIDCIVEKEAMGGVKSASSSGHNIRNIELPPFLE